jgi:hypothetical protein
MNMRPTALETLNADYTTTSLKLWDSELCSGHSLTQHLNLYKEIKRFEDIFNDMKQCKSNEARLVLEKELEGSLKEIRCYWVCTQLDKNKLDFQGYNIK